MPYPVAAVRGFPGRKTAPAAAGPTPAIATTVTDKSINLTFSANVTGATNGTAAGFALTASGGAATLVVNRTNGAVITFDVNRSIVGGETLTLAYTPGAVVAASGGASVAAFGGFAVTNTMGGGAGPT